MFGVGDSCSLFRGIFFGRYQYCCLSLDPMLLSRCFRGFPDPLSISFCGCHIFVRSGHSLGFTTPTPYYGKACPAVSFGCYVPCSYVRSVVPARPWSFASLLPSFNPGRPVGFLFGIVTTLPSFRRALPSSSVSILFNPSFAHATEVRWWSGR